MHLIPEQMARNHMSLAISEVEVWRASPRRPRRPPGGGGRAPRPAGSRGGRPGRRARRPSPSPSRPGRVRQAARAGDPPRGSPARRRPPDGLRVRQDRSATHPDRTALDAAVAALRRPALAGFVAVVAWPDPDAGRDGTGRPRAVLVADHGGTARLDAEHPDGVVWSRVATRCRAPTRWPSCRTPSRWPTRRRPTSATPTRCRGCASRRSSPTRAAPTSPSCTRPGTGSPSRAATAASTGRSTSSSRARPCCSPGAGVRRRGLVADHARLVDVMPTLAWVAGVEREALGAPRRRGARRPRRPGVRPHVIGLLWDGGHAGLAARPRRGAASCRTSRGCSSAAARSPAGRSRSSRA